MTIVSDVTASTIAGKETIARDKHICETITSNETACNDCKRWKIATIASNDTIANDRWMDRLQRERWIVCSLQHD